MKRLLLLFTILGMVSMAYGQAYTYLPWGGTAYAVPDETADETSELLRTAGRTFTKFDRTGEASTPQEDMDKTFGSNNAGSTDGAGTDQDRGWNTKDPDILPSVGYYSCIRAIGNAGSGAYTARSWGAWMYFTVNFTESGVYDLLLRARDGTKDQTYEISIFSPSDMSTPLFTKTTNFTGASGLGSVSTDGSAKVMALIDAGSGGSVWYKITDGFTPPSTGSYVVKINNTQSAGAGALGSFTFWKQTAPVAPEVVVTSPVNQSIYEAGQTIILTAKATAGDGTLAGVEFFNGETSLGQGLAAGDGVYTLDIIAAGQVYDFKAVVTETGGVEPHTANSLGVVKVLGIDEPFDGSTYPGTPWNATPWSFGVDNSSNFAVGSGFDRMGEADKYIGIPGWAFDLGSVNNTIGASSTTLRYVAGSTTSNSGSTGVDVRAAKALEASKTLLPSDNYSRLTTNLGAARFLFNTTDYRFSAGGAWLRYSCNFAPGKYKILVRASNSNCGENFNLYARFLRADGTVITSETNPSGIYMWNSGFETTACDYKLNVTNLDVLNAPYLAFTSPSTATYWVSVNDEIALDGAVIVELSDPHPVDGGNTPGNSTFGEFTFEYVGPTSTKDVQSNNNFKVFATQNTLTVEYNQSDAAMVSVYDLNGKRILSKQIVNGRLVTEFPASGIYIVKLQTRSNILVKKIFVN